MWRLVEEQPYEMELYYGDRRVGKIYAGRMA